MTELEVVRQFIKANQHLESIAAMEEARDTAIGWLSRIGELLNMVTLAYEEKQAEVYRAVNVGGITEVGRRAEIGAAVAGLKFQMNELKHTKHILSAMIRAWTQNIKTRREERV